MDESARSFATIPPMTKRPTVALTDYDNERRAPGAQWSKSHTKFGEVKWAEPVTHEARNTGTTEQRVIRVELK